MSFVPSQSNYIEITFLSFKKIIELKPCIDFKDLIKYFSIFILSKDEKSDTIIKFI